jgi:hypothetical protein
LAYGTQRSVSADGAGGGLVTTAHDLARLIRAFADDRLFLNRAAREQMLTWTPTGEPGIDCGLGVRRLVPALLGMSGSASCGGTQAFSSRPCCIGPNATAQCAAPSTSRRRAAHVAPDSSANAITLTRQQPVDHRAAAGCSTRRTRSEQCCDWSASRARSRLCAIFPVR